MLHYFTARVSSRRKIVVFLNRVGREQCLGKFAEVKPLERCPLEGTIVQVEAVYIEVDDSHDVPRTRHCTRVTE
jgi:hypothetical protein